MKGFWKIATSLRLTVLCLAFGIVLIWVGTVAQADEGLYQAQVRYFKQWIVWGVTLWGHRLPIVLPGGYLIGTTLLINLVASHIKRFHWSWAKLGIHLTHGGIVIMLVGQLATDMLSVESHLAFHEGETKTYTESHLENELAFATDVGDGREEVVAIPERTLTARDARIDLPFHTQTPALSVAVKDYGVNCQVRQRAPMMDKGEPPATEGFGAHATVIPLAETKSMDSRNLPYAVIEIFHDGQSLGTWLVSAWLNEQEFTVNGTTYRTALRPRRFYFGKDIAPDPFSIKLLKTTHEVYRGTDIPRNFQSRVRIENPVTHENREVDIYMNNPLRYEGLTFFQSQMGKEELGRAVVGTSTLETVRNPSWLAPYLGCIVVGFGMAFQFLLHLTRFVRKRTASAR